MSTKLIKGALIVTEDANRKIYRKGDILIKGTKIAAIGEDLGNPEAEVIDGKGMIALPGFVDAHRHSWESLIRSVGVDWTLAQYMMAIKFVLGPLYTADDIYCATYLSAVEALECGITTLFDWFHNINGPDFADAAIQGYKDAGIRCVLGYANSVKGELPVSDYPMDYEDFRRVKKQYFSAKNDMMSLCLATRGPQFETIDLFLKEMKIAREYDMFVTMNAGDGIWGKVRPIQQLKDLGLMDFDYTFVHCNTLSDEEIQMIGDMGAACVSCPEVELNMGHGYPPTLRELKAGIKPAFGVDVTTSVPSDMFGPMRFLLAGVRSVVNAEGLKTGEPIDPLPILATDVLHFATQHGADACKMGDLTGSLTVGKEADITLLDTCAANLIPMNDPVGAIVEAAHTGNVDTVLVAGEFKKRNKKLVGVDMQLLSSRIEKARDGLFGRAGVPATGEWKPEPYRETPDSK